MEHPSSPDLYISYAESERSWAEWLAWQLEAMGYTVVLSAWDFRPGSNTVVERHKATQTARTVLVLSPNALQAPELVADWTSALAEDPTGEARRLIPVKVQACQPTGLLKNILTIDRTDFIRAKKQLMDIARTARRTGERAKRLRPRRTAQTVAEGAKQLSVRTESVVQNVETWAQTLQKLETPSDPDAQFAAATQRSNRVVLGVILLSNAEAALINANEASIDEAVRAIASSTISDITIETPDQVGFADVKIPSRNASCPGFTSAKPT